jgi:hypothetical protein
MIEQVEQRDFIDGVYFQPVFTESGYALQNRYARRLKSDLEFTYSVATFIFMVVRRSCTIPPWVQLKIGVLRLLLASLELIKQELARASIAFIVLEAIKEVTSIRRARIRLSGRRRRHGSGSLFFGRRRRSSTERSSNGTNGLVGNGATRAKGHALHNGTSNSRQHPSSTASRLLHGSWNGRSRSGSDWMGCGGRGGSRSWCSGFGGSRCGRCHRTTGWSHWTTSGSCTTTRSLLREREREREEGVRNEISIRRFTTTQQKPHKAKIGN